MLESFAAGLPCVMNPIAAEGITLPASLQGLVAGDAAGLAKQIVRFHTDERVNNLAGAAGRRFTRREFGATAVVRALGKALNEPSLIVRSNGNGRVRRGGAGPRRNGPSNSLMVSVGCQERRVALQS